MENNSIAPCANELSHSLNTILLLLDREGIVKQIEAHPPSLFNFPSTHLLGKNWFKTCVPDHTCQNALLAFQKLFDNKTHQLKHQPYPIITSTHKEHRFIWYSLPHFDNKPSMNGIFLVGFDIAQLTLSKHSVDIALQRVTANAQVVLDNAVEAIIRICPQGKVLTFNKSAETMFGYTTKEVLGKSINLLMPTPDREQHDQYIKHYLKTGDKKIIGIDREVLGLRKDGTIFPMELSVSETKIENEHSFTGIIRDISERKDAEEKLRLRDQELQEIRHRIAHMDRLNVMGEMATGIAHELNQPLTAIATYAQASNRLLNNTLKNTNDLSHALMQINEQAQRAGKIIRRLRSIITRQQQVYQRTNINILILETIELTHMDSKIKDITIETQFFTPMPDVELDTIQIQQVLLNLIRNAADAMKHHHETQTKNKKIIIRTVVESHVLRVEVIDNGPGIPSAEKSEIFNPFFTTKNDGMGMGLAICRSILTAHGGELDVNINNKEGTEFYFTLPIHFIN